MNPMIARVKKSNMYSHNILRHEPKLITFIIRLMDIADGSVIIMVVCSELLLNLFQVAGS
jgi:hypothetical protein